MKSKSSSQLFRALLQSHSNLGLGSSGGCQRSALRFAACLGACLAAASPTVRADLATTATWTGGGANTNWSTVANWNTDPAFPGEVGGTTDTSAAIFTGTTGVLTPTLAQNINLQNITFGPTTIGGAQAAAGAYTIYSEANSLRLTSGGSITANVTATADVVQNETIFAPIRLQGAGGAADGTYTFLSSSASTGSGTPTANTYLVFRSRSRPTPRLAPPPCHSAVATTWSSAITPIARRT